jgi:hypothetical protein
MLKRVEIKGFIELQEGAELPALGEVITVSEFRAEVTGEVTERQKRRGETTELVYTRRTHILDGAEIDGPQILKVEPAPTPLFTDESAGADE